MTKPLSERLEALLREHRETMAADVLMSWARDALVEMAEAAALARRVEGALTTEAVVAGWLAKAAIYDSDKCNESDLHAWVLRDCANDLVSISGQRVRLVPEVGA